jgi:hypothetical protein
VLVRERTRLVAVLVREMTRAAAANLKSPAAATMIEAYNPGGLQPAMVATTLEAYNNSNGGLQPWRLTTNNGGNNPGGLQPTMVATTMEAYNPGGLQPWRLTTNDGGNNCDGHLEVVKELDLSFVQRSNNHLH